MVAEAQVDVVHAIETTFISTPLQNLTTTTATISQDIPATISTAKTLLLLTTGPKFDRTAAEATSDSTKSSAAHIEKQPFEEPSIANVLPNAAKVQMDLIMANQQTIMANQYALERRINKMENLML